MPSMRSAPPSSTTPLSVSGQETDRTNRSVRLAGRRDCPSASATELLRPRRAASDDRADGSARGTEGAVTDVLDLDPADAARDADVDILTFELVRHGLSEIADEMMSTLTR